MESIRIYQLKLYSKVLMFLCTGLATGSIIYKMFSSLFTCIQIRIMVCIILEVFLVVSIISYIKRRGIFYNISTHDSEILLGKFFITIVGFIAYFKYLV
jgi:hypothetical protein